MFLASTDRIPRPGGGLGRAQQQPDTRLEFGCPTLCSAATGSCGARVQSTADTGHQAAWQYGRVEMQTLGAGYM